MTPKQISLVKQSWAQVVPISDQAAALFYGRLFELDPSLSSLFSGDMGAQGKKLMSMLNTAVSTLDVMANLTPALQALGKRHVGYGVKTADYDIVGAALLWTLEQGLQEGYTEEVAEAWTQAYATLAGVMVEAAAEG